MRIALGDRANVIEALEVLSRTPQPQPHERIPEAARSRLGTQHGQGHLLLRTMLRLIVRTLSSGEAKAIRNVIFQAVYVGAVMELIKKIIMIKHSHTNARLPPKDRHRLAERCRIDPISYVAAEMGISRATASKWINRYKQFGKLGLYDRSSSPIRQPTATPGHLVKTVEGMLRKHKWSASRHAFKLNQSGTPVSRRTVNRLLVQLSVNRRDLPGPCEAPNRNTKQDQQQFRAKHPRRIVRLDVTRAGLIPDGIGWRVCCEGTESVNDVPYLKTCSTRK